MVRAPAGTSPFVTDEPQHFGSGWLSGTIGAVLGIAASGTAVCLALPQHLTLPALRASYPVPFVVSALHAAIPLAFVLGLLSLWLRRKKTLGAIAIGTAALAATVFAVAPPLDAAGSTTVGLGVDVFVFTLVVYAAVFLPLERLWPLRSEQPTFRPEWWTDLAWFASSALLMQATSFVILAPANALATTTPAGLRAAIASLPLVVQFPAIVLVSDLVQCPRSPRLPPSTLLWRFHAIHHSATSMDWLAGSRLHVVDAVLTRSLVYLPLAMLGFAPAAIAAYLVFVAAQATFVHTNLRWRLAWLEPWLVVPRFHHWHHADSVRDVNFAVHVPWLDRVFGTFHLPANDWPDAYGLADGAAGPRGFLRQLLAPFGRR